MCITWLVEPPLKNLLTKLDHPVLKFRSLISVAMHIISPQQPPLQSSSSRAFCKRMCLIVRLRIRNHLKGKKIQKNELLQRSWKCARKRDMELFRESKHLQITNTVWPGSMLLSFKGGVDTRSWPLLYMMFQHIKLKALVDQPHLLHVSSVGEGVDQVSHAPAIIGRLAVRVRSTACEAVFPFIWFPFPLERLSWKRIRIQSNDSAKIMLPREILNTWNRRTSASFKYLSLCRLPGMSHSSILPLPAVEKGASIPLTWSCVFAQYPPPKT